MYKSKVPRTPFAHPDSDRLLKGIREVPILASTWKGDVYRVTTVERANEKDLTSGEGSKIWGGRWNPPGLFRTVYCSLDYATAMEEFLAGNRRSGLPDIYSTPSVTTGVNLVLHRVLDLTLSEVQKSVSITAASMVMGSQALNLIQSTTQAIGRLAFSEGYEGLLVPSAARLGHKNIVVFPARLKGGQMRPINPDRLPGRIKAT